MERDDVREVGEQRARDLNPEERKRFEYHTMDDAQRRASDTARASITLTADTLGRLLPAGRDRALVLTKLEEALFHANACIARNPAAF